MARNRIIKPEYWADARIGKLSFGARLLYIAMWNFSDDYGVISASPRRLLGEAFENDESVTIDNVNAWLTEIENQERIKKFVANDKEWYKIVHFADHQKVSHKSTRVNPQPSGDSPATLRQVTGSNDNVNGNGNVNEKENGSPSFTDTADALTPEGQLLAKACVCFGSSPNDCALTDNRLQVLKLIRGDRRIGADKFILACQNRARAPDVPGEISVDYFLNKFEYQERITKWAQGVPKYGKFSDNKKNSGIRSVDIGDGAPVPTRSVGG